MFKDKTFTTKRKWALLYTLFKTRIANIWEYPPGLCYNTYKPGGGGGVSHQDLGGGFLLGSYNDDPVYDRKTEIHIPVYDTYFVRPYVTNQRRLNCLVQGTAYWLDERKYPEYDKKHRKFKNRVETDTLFMTRKKITHTLSNHRQPKLFIWLLTYKHTYSCKKSYHTWTLNDIFLLHKL